jgi:hypothetical protein
MTQKGTPSQFDARLLRPKESGNGTAWAFVVLPKAVSATLPRRGRVTVAVAINGESFTALLEPDGQKSHWLRIDEKRLSAAGVDFGDTVRFEIAPVEQEPEPEAPADLLEVLAASPAAQATWDRTTAIARLDWIHWITSAKQTKTRIKRIRDACDMLASGKKRVCCFDPSGFYSKALSAPEAAE